MASVKILLRTNKTLANGNHPIVIRIIKDRKAKFIFTGKSATKAQWDEKSGLPNKKHPLHKELVIYLKKKLLDAETEIIQYEKDDVYFSAETVKDNLRRSKATKSFFSYIDNMIKDLEAIGQIGNRNRLISCRNAVLRFTKGSRALDFRDITPSFLLRFEQHSRILGLADATICFYIKGISSVFFHAIANTTVVNEDMNPFKVYDLGKFKSEPNHRALEKATMDKLFSYIPEEGTIDFHALNYFKFSYYCWGINMKDIALLKWKNIHNNRIYYVRSKTKKIFNIPILAPIEKILEYYKSTTNAFAEDYIFPILDDKVYTTSIKQVHRIKSRTKDTNTRLRKMAKEMGITDHITTYMSRHSFASNLRDMDIPAAKIQQMLGHQSETTTQTYLNAIKSSELDEAVMRLLE